MAKVLIIGAGGVGSVVAKKCVQASDTFDEVVLASRTLARCEEIRADILKRYKKTIAVDHVDANEADNVIALIEEHRPDIVINVALPYHDLPIMDACVATHTHYLDTANYEPKDQAKFEYKWQWAYREKFAQRSITAILGCGFDPGVTNAFCAYAQKHLFDTIETIDILDCNAGSHGHPFATNFNPEINIREVTQVVRHWNNGKWVETPPIIEEGCVHRTFVYPEIGPKESYLLYHEELESLAQNIPGVQRIRFWMTFSEQYLTHLRVLHNVGLTRIDPVVYKGVKIIPLEFLKTLLPDPASLAKNYKGKTNIGCVITGVKDGKRQTKYLYNVCDHEEAFREVGAQAISYTTGVPAMIGAKLVVEGAWKRPGVWNVEQLDPDPLLEQLPRFGLPWHLIDTEPIP